MSDTELRALERRVAEGDLSAVPPLQRALLRAGRGWSSYGFRELDALTGGLNPGELVLVGARSSNAKTTFLLNLARRASLDPERKQRVDGHLVIFALEPTPKEIKLVLSCSLARVNTRDALHRRLSRTNARRYYPARKLVRAARLHLESLPRLTVEQIGKKLDRFRQHQVLAGVLIDGLFNIAASKEDFYLPPTGHLRDFMRDLKALAQRLQVPVLVTSGLYPFERHIHGIAPDLMLHTPERAHLDADTAISLYRPSYYGASPPRLCPTWEDLLVTVAKSRSGRTGTVKLSYAKSMGLIEEAPGKLKGAQEGLSGSRVSVRLTESGDPLVIVEDPAS